MLILQNRDLIIENNFTNKIELYSTYQIFTRQLIVGTPKYCYFKYGNTLNYGTTISFSFKEV